MSKAMLGKFKVDEKLLDNYVELFIENQTTEPSLLMLQLSGRLANIHKLLRESVGLSGYWSSDRKDPFDKALWDYTWKKLNEDKRYVEYMRVQRAILHDEQKITESKEKMAFIESFRKKEA